jgi:hypothetical protein
MEMILARAFLKEADLVSTSTKKGAVIKEDSVNIDQLPDLIAKSVLSNTSATHYVPKERKKKGVCRVVWCSRAIRVSCVSFMYACRSSVVRVSFACRSSVVRVSFECRSRVVRA